MNRQEIIREFKEFMTEPWPEDLIAAYDNEFHLIGQVFMIVRTPTGLISTEAVNVDTVYTFPVAKVLGIGDKWKGCRAEVGGYVRLRDWDSMTVDNPAYKTYQEGVEEFKDGNLRPNQGPPSPTITRLWELHIKHTFHPDPFYQMDIEGKEYVDTFAFTEGGPLFGIKDINAFLKSI